MIGSRWSCTCVQAFLCLSYLVVTTLKQSPRLVFCSPSFRTMKRMRTSSIFTALLLLLGYRVSAQNVCLNPGPSGDSADFSDNVVYPLGSVIDLSWKTSYPEVSLAIWQQNLDYEAASMFPLFNKKTGIYSYQWTVGLGGTGFNLDDSNGKSSFVERLRQLA